jgi:hypothetical protein
MICSRRCRSRGLSITARILRPLQRPRSAALSLRRIVGGRWSAGEAGSRSWNTFSLGRSESSTTTSRPRRRAARSESRSGFAKSTWCPSPVRTRESIRRTAGSSFTRRMRFFIRQKNTLWPVAGVSRATGSGGSPQNLTANRRSCTSAALRANTGRFAWFGRRKLS